MMQIGFITHTTAALMRSKKTESSGSIAELQRQICGNLFLQPHFRDLLDTLESASVFIKSVDGRLVYGNASLLRRLGLRHDTDLLGHTDPQLLPPHLVEKYRQDDLDVIRTGRPKLNLIEIFKNEQGLLQWFVTHKYPVLDGKRRIVGVMGCIQEYRKMNPAASTGDSSILAAAEHIQKNYRGPIAIESLSKQSGMPMRQFERKFKLLFDASPREYIIRHRLRYACEALRNTRQSIVKICAEAGFYDQSSFTRQFKKYMNLTPLKYRKSPL